MNKLTKDNGITLIALIITIIVLLILAGVTLNAIIGDNGVVTNAQKAKIEAEEAELWEKVQMVLIEGMGQDLNKEEFVTRINEQFKNQNLEAKIGLRADGYAVTYGKYSRKVALLSDNLQLLGEIVAIEGSSEVWETDVKEDGTLILKKYNGDAKGKIQIPNIIDGKFVTEIGIGLFMNSSITSVNIPEGIEIIDKEAFANCSDLNCEIIFPSSLKEIGESAFYGCVGIKGNLNSIVSQGIKTGKNVFAKCEKMTGDIQVLIDTLPDNVTEITDEQFSGFSGVTGILTIPERITSIGANAFSKCSGIEEIKFESESKLQTIENYAFSQCSNVSNRLNLPDSVTTIGEYAFNECSSLTGVDLSTSLTNIGNGAFKLCTNLSGDLIFPASLNSTGEEAFRNCGKLNISFAKRTDIAIISSNCFTSCGNETKLVVPETSLKIEREAFRWSGITEIENSEDIKELGSQAFSGSKIGDVNLNGLTSIPSSAFSDCKNLKKLPEISNVEEINDSAFAEDINLKDNVIEYLQKSKVREVGSFAFKNCSKLSGSFTGKISNENSEGTEIILGSSVFVGTSVERETQVEISEDGYLVLNNGDTILPSEFSGTKRFIGKDNKEVKIIKIPDSIKSIGEGAFSGCESLEKIELPDSVEIIGDGAFSDCKALKEINIPKNNKLTKIPNNCFRDCSKLTQIELPENITELGNTSFMLTNLNNINLDNVKKIGYRCFRECKSLTNVKLGNELTYLDGACFEKSGINSIEIPNSVTNIGDYQFSGCENLTNIKISSEIQNVPIAFASGCVKLDTVEFVGNISKIGEGAFSGDTNLSKINLEWSGVTNIGPSAFKDCSKLKGEITLSKECVYDLDSSFSNCNLTIKRN